MSLVIDASVALAWASPDEASAYADEAMRRVVDGGAAVPAIWFLEVANILLVNERKGRLEASEAAEIMADLRTLDLAADAETAARAMGETAALARERGLTVYDAAYLELARRLSLPLATLDKRLREAAEAIGLPPLPVQGAAP